MTNIQILFGLLLTMSVIIRSFSMKQATQKFPSKEITFINLFISSIITLLIIPVFMQELIILKDITPDRLIGIAASIIKGVFIFLLSRYGLNLTRESNSSIVFTGFIALGIGSIVNSQIMQNELNPIQLTACVLLGILGIIFFLKGPAKHLTPNGKKAFIISVASVIGMMAVDKVGIGENNWYIHMLIGITTASLLSIIAILKNKNYEVFKIFKRLNNLTLLTSCIVFFLYDFIILYIMGLYLPVSIAILFSRLSAPIVMVLSAYIYKESTPKQQLLFGGLAYLISILIFF